MNDDFEEVAALDETFPVWEVRRCGHKDGDTPFYRVQVWERHGPSSRTKTTPVKHRTMRGAMRAAVDIKFLPVVPLPPHIYISSDTPEKNASRGMDWVISTTVWVPQKDGTRKMETVSGSALTEREAVSMVDQYKVVLDERNKEWETLYGETVRSGVLGETFEWGMRFVG